MYKQTLLQEEQAINLNQFMELVEDDEKEQMAELLGNATLQEVYNDQITSYEWF